MAHENIRGLLGTIKLDAPLSTSKINTKRSFIKYKIYCIGSTSTVSHPAQFVMHK